MKQLLLVLAIPIGLYCLVLLGGALVEVRSEYHCKACDDRGCVDDIAEWSRSEVESRARACRVLGYTRGGPETDCETDTHLRYECASKVHWGWARWLSFPVTH